MKRLIVIFVITLMIIPTNIFASTSFNEYPPYIKLSNSELYDVEKIIDSKNVTVRIKKKNQKNYYSWTFDKEKVGDTIDIDFEVNFDSNNKELIENIVGKGKKKIISFTHHGALPSDAKITVYVGDEYKNGETLNLYYFNQEEGKIETIDTGIKVINGYVEFSISHCSDYFLTTININKEKEKIEMPININYIIVGMSVVAIVLISKAVATAK